MPMHPQTSPHDSLIALFVQLLGVGTFALVAGISDEVGKVVVIIMAGLMIVWAFTHGNVLQRLAQQA